MTGISLGRSKALEHPDAGAPASEDQGDWWRQARSDGRAGGGPLRGPLASTPLRSFSGRGRRDNPDYTGRGGDRPPPARTTSRERPTGQAKTVRRSASGRAASAHCRRGLEAEGEAAEDGARRPCGVMDVRNAACRLAGQPRREVELRLPPVDVGEVLDADEGLEPLVSIPSREIEEGVARAVCWRSSSA